MVFSQIFVHMIFINFPLILIFFSLAAHRHYDDAKNHVTIATINSFILSSPFPFIEIFWNTIIMMLCARFHGRNHPFILLLIEPFSREIISDTYKMAIPFCVCVWICLASDDTPPKRNQTKIKIISVHAQTKPGHTEPKQSSKTVAEPSQWLGSINWPNRPDARENTFEPLSNANENNKSNRIWRPIV